MVTSDGIGQQVTENVDVFHGVLGVGGGVVSAGDGIGIMRVRDRSCSQVVLESIGVLPKVVPKPSDSRPIASVKARTARSRVLRNILQVAEEVLPFRFGTTRQCVRDLGAPPVAPARSWLHAASD